MSAILSQNTSESPSGTSQDTTMPSTPGDTIQTDEKVCVFMYPRIDGISSNRESIDVSVQIVCSYPPGLDPLNKRGLSMRTKRKHMLDAEGLARAADKVFCQEVAAGLSTATHYATYACTDADGNPVPADACCATEMFWTTDQMTELFRAAGERTGQRLMEEYQPKIGSLGLGISIADVNIESANDPSAYCSAMMDNKLAYRNRPHHLDIEVPGIDVAGGPPIMLGAAMIWERPGPVKAVSRSTGPHSACFEPVVQTSECPPDRVFMRQYRLGVGTVDQGHEWEDRTLSRFVEDDGTTHSIRRYELGIYPRVDLAAMPSTAEMSLVPQYYGDLPSC